MFNNILVAVDGSEHSYHAAKLAGEMAREASANLWLVTAFDYVPDYLGEPYLSRAITRRMEYSEEIFEEAKKVIGELPDNLKIESLEGQPAEAILRVAETREIDLIVMGTRGQGRLSSILLGSQSQKVVGHAPCPVMLVK